MILLLDNFDSFTYNLVDYFEQLGLECFVVRNDVAIEEITIRNYQALIISPGPETPLKSGNLMEVLAFYTGKIPILGICLGHQAIGVQFGAKLEKALKPMHGKISVIEHDEDVLFKAIPKVFKVVRYNSLLLNSIGGPLRIIATTEQNEVMAIAHNSLPIIGIQFHPEAALTEFGLQLLQNWITKNGLVANQ